MYHINKNGLPKKCNKDPENCNLGGPEEHFETENEAQRYADKIMSESFLIIPDVKLLSASIPSDEILEAMNYKYSEIYSSAMFLNNSEHLPVLCLGIDNLNKKVYQFFNYNDGVYYDINGVVASSKGSLEDYISNKYNITNSLYIVNYPESLDMINILLSIDLSSYSAIVDFEEYIKSRLKDSSAIEREVLEYISQELN